MNTPSALCANDVQERATTWLVPGLIPEFTLSIIDGDPGQGKSFLTLELAAALSIGYTIGPLGRVQASCRTKTLIANSEDDLAATLRPRLRGLGADLKQVYFLPMKPGAERPLQVYLPDDLNFIERHLRETEAKLLVVDPLMGYLSPYIKANSDQAVRIALGALRNLAESLRITVILVRHLNKSGGSKAIYRGGGSIGITGLVRSALFVGPNPEDKDTKILAQVKSNLGPIQKPWQFRMVTAADGPCADQRLRRLEWLGTVDIPLSRLLSERPEALPIEKAEAFLKRLLTDASGMRIRDIQEAADAHGIKRHTLRNAKESLGLETEKRGKDQYWLPPGISVKVDEIERIKRDAQRDQEKESGDENS
jgi:hypothetical protein